jgi:hypothetical protein
MSLTVALVKVSSPFYLSILMSFPLNSVRCDASRHFGNNKKAYLKAKIEELETNSKLKNVSDMYYV